MVQRPRSRQRLLRLFEWSGFPERAERLSLQRRRALFCRGRRPMDMVLRRLEWRFHRILQRPAGGQRLLRFVERSGFPDGAERQSLQRRRALFCRRRRPVDLVLFRQQWRRNSILQSPSGGRRLLWLVERSGFPERAERLSLRRRRALFCHWHRTMELVLRRLEWRFHRILQRPAGGQRLLRFVERSGFPDGAERQSLQRRRALFCRRRRPVDLVLFRQQWRRNSILQSPSGGRRLLWLVERSGFPERAERLSLRRRRALFCHWHRTMELVLRRQEWRRNGILQRLARHQWLLRFSQRRGCLERADDQSVQFRDRFTSWGRGPVELDLCRQQWRCCGLL